MTKRSWSKIGIAIGGILMLGAVGGGIELGRISGKLQESLPEQFRQFAIPAGIVCAIQFAVGSLLLWYAIRGLRRNPIPMETANKLLETDSRVATGE